MQLPKNYFCLTLNLLLIYNSMAFELFFQILKIFSGTHHLRFHNNRQQVWASSKVRRQMGLKPANPTEEGLASIHSVLMRKYVVIFILKKGLEFLNFCYFSTQKDVC